MTLLHTLTLLVNVNVMQLEPSSYILIIALLLTIIGWWTVSKSGTETEVFKDPKSLQHLIHSYQYNIVPCLIKVFVEKYLWGKMLNIPSRITVHITSLILHNI